MDDLKHLELHHKVAKKKPKKSKLLPKGVLVFLPTQIQFQNISYILFF
jgi:hypothetical protein